MTWATAYGLLRRHVASTHHLDSWISSRDELQAKLFIADCHLFGSIFEIAARTLRSTLWHSSSSLSISFANGSTIHSLSSSPDAQAGKRGNRILDEFALHGDPRLLYAIALPGITWGGQLEILSTHRGSLNFFNQLVQEARHGGNPKKFSLHRVTLQDALEQGFLQKLKEKLPGEDPRHFMDEAQYFDFIRSTCPDEATFQQEYMCQPLDDRDAFLPYDLIGQCEIPPEEFKELDPEGERKNAPRFPLFLGVDLGRDQDLTVFWLVEAVGDVLVTRRVECLSRQSFASQEKTLDHFLRLDGLRRACIDQTGMGRQFVEQAVDRFGKFRVEGITLTASSKETLAYGLRTAFERRELRIPADPAIRADLHSVRRETTLSGNLRLSAERGRNGHGDRFWALALAIHGAKGGRSWASHFAGNGAPFQVIERSKRSLFF
jgi:phage FluMu gp28-like protein